MKVFSRFESIKKALKNYTIAATPDDKSSVLQQVCAAALVFNRLFITNILTSSSSWYTITFQGGMFVFKGKQLLYARKDEGTGDHAPLEDILNICCKTPVP